MKKIRRRDAQSDTQSDNQNDTKTLDLTLLTRDDFTDGTAVYEYVYQFEENKFELNRILEIVSDVAMKAGFRSFKRTYQEYAKSIKQGSGTWVADSTTAFEGQPFELNCGKWNADDMGISIETPFGEVEACNHPIMPAQRLVNIDTGVEKLTLAFRKGKKWRTTIADKRTLASSNSILDLANVGVAVNSENAKYLVRYLTEVEHLNYNAIPEIRSVGRLGWINDEEFSPFVDDLQFDGDANYRNFFESVKPQGKLSKWLDLAKEVRKSGSIASRIMLAASFASVLVGPLGELPFFVHLWGSTATGKTVCLMLCCSVWADPEVGRYIHTFNSTLVGREKSAAFVNSMPLILDELQVAGDRRQFDRDIYALTEGAGRTRGTKTGGIDKVSTWANCILSSGEMPITTQSSAGGAINRVVEVQSEGDLFPDPRAVADEVRLHYGHAGRKFVEFLMSEGAVDRAKSIHKAYYDTLATTSETAKKQAGAAAVILTADELATELLFKDGRNLCVNEIEGHLHTNDAVSADLRGYNYLVDTLISNMYRFQDNPKDGEVWGKYEGDEFAVIPSVFNRICREGGFNDRSLLSWMRTKDLLKTRTKGFTIGRWINSVRVECYAVQLPPEDEVAEEGKEVTKWLQTENSGFSENEQQVELPF